MYVCMYVRTYACMYVWYVCMVDTDIHAHSQASQASPLLSGLSTFRGRHENCKKVQMSRSESGECVKMRQTIALLEEEVCVYVCMYVYV